MTFWLLSSSVCVSVFFLTLISAQSIVLLLRRVITHRVRSASPQREANGLFAVLTLPVFIAAITSGGLALPAFLRFEPRVTSEGVGVRLWILSGLGLAVLGTMFLRALHISWTTRRFTRHWSENSVELSAGIAGSEVPLYAVNETSSLLAVTGIFRPKIFVSREVVRSLSPDELSAALAHEVAHISVLDNLKQWVLKIAQMPRWLSARELDTSVWSRAAEIAADDGALRSGASALDLAAALLKVANLKCDSLKCDSTMCESPAVSHLIPSGPYSALETRVGRLQASVDQPLSAQRQGRNRLRPQVFLLITLPLLAYGVCLAALLPIIHDALELLVNR